MAQQQGIAMKFGADIHGAQRMNPYDFGAPLTLPEAPTAGQSFQISLQLFPVSFFTTTVQ